MRSAATVSKKASGSKRGWRVTAAPICRAGTVWMLRPPTWNIGSTVSTRSCGVSSNRAMALSAFAATAAWVSSAPLGRPVVPEV